MNYKNIKYYLGPMTENIIDAVIEYSNETGILFGFVPSRRQIEWDGGYTGFTTHNFINYVRDNSEHIIIERDHAGIGQGKELDNGMLSILKDAEDNIDLIHIDPWKIYKNYDDGLRETLDTINFILHINDNINFEVGTEEAILKFSSIGLYRLLKDLKNNLGDYFSKIKYAVIQSGTSLQGTKNTGEFNLNRLKEMVEVCNEFGVMSKEHNGDYLSKKEIQLRFDNGLNAINIAPEIGVFETKLLLDHINNNEDFETIFNICVNGGNWRKWVPYNFIPELNKRELIKICGHYHNIEIKKFTKIDDKFIIVKIKEYLDELANIIS